MSNGNSPAPLAINQDDVEFLRRIVSVVLPTLLHADGSVNGTGLQRFYAGLIAGPTQVDYLTTNISGPATAPSVAAGAGLGSGGTATLLQGNVSSHIYASGNFAGTLRLVTGTGPTANATLATVSFGNDVNGELIETINNARVMLFPVDKTTRQVCGPTQHPIVTADRFGDGWSVLSNDTALAASTTYLWHYLLTA